MALFPISDISTNIAATNATSQTMQRTLPSVQKEIRYEKNAKLSKDLQSSNLTVKAMAIETIGEIGDTTFRFDLFALMESEKNTYITMQAMFALARMAGKHPEITTSVFTRILSFAQKENESVDNRVAAVTTIGLFGPTSMIKDLENIRKTSAGKVVTNIPNVIIEMQKRAEFERRSLEAMTISVNRAKN